MHPFGRSRGCGCGPPLYGIDPYCSLVCSYNLNGDGLCGRACHCGRPFGQDLQGWALDRSVLLRTGSSVWADGHHGLPCYRRFLWLRHSAFLPRTGCSLGYFTDRHGLGNQVLVGSRISFTMHRRYWGVMRLLCGLVFGYGLWTLRAIGDTVLLKCWAVACTLWLTQRRGEGLFILPFYYKNLTYSVVKYRFDVICFTCPWPSPSPCTIIKPIFLMWPISVIHRSSSANSTLCLNGGKHPPKLLSYL